MSPALLLTLLTTAAVPADRGQVERVVQAMGTSLRIVVTSESRAAALDASEQALRAVSECEQRLSSWRADSELSRFNATEVGQPFEVSELFGRDLASARFWHEATDGAFDPAIGALVDAWGLGHGGRVPSPAELASARSGSGWRQIELVDGSARRLHADVRLTAGAFGKGIALDDALAALAKAGVTSALLDFGGQIAVLGSDATTVAIADPRDRTRTLLDCRIATGSFATSGNSERGFEIDGERYGHILDPHSGRPSPDFGSVSVWSPSATAADCLSTALYVMGPEQALAWAEARPDVEAIVVQHTGSKRTVLATSGLAGALDCSDPTITIQFASPASSSPAKLGK